MKLTQHARERMRRRGISASRVEAALSWGRDFWRKGALLIIHGNLRLIFCPFSGYVITAWWQNSRPTRRGQSRKHQNIAVA